MLANTEEERTGDVEAPFEATAGLIAGTVGARPGGSMNSTNCRLTDESQPTLRETVTTGSMMPMSVVMCTRYDASPWARSTRVRTDLGGTRLSPA